MDKKEIIKTLENFNNWRRYDGDMESSPDMPCPNKIGVAIDEAVKLLKKYRV